MEPEKKRLWKQLNQNDRQLGLLLTPSWFSGVITVVVSAAFIGAAVATLQYSGSTLQYLASVQQEHNRRSVAIGYQAVDSQLASSSIISYIPLFIFWAGVGLIVYYLSASLVHAFSRVAYIQDEMDYVNIDRQQLIRGVIESFLLRVATLAVLILFVHYSLHGLMAYIIAVAYAAGGAIGTLAGAGYLLWGFLLGVICLHMNLVLVRLLFLRPRLFGVPTVG